MSEAMKVDALLPEQRAEFEEIRAVVMAGHGLGTANSAWLIDLVDRVAALVAAAEERGFDRGVRAAGSGPALAAVRAEAEWRGAEKERERAIAAVTEEKDRLRRRGFEDDLDKARVIGLMDALNVLRALDPAS